MVLDRYDSPDAEALLVAAQDTSRPVIPRRKLTTTIIGAVGFLVAATLLAALAPWDRPLHVTSLVLVLAAWLILDRVRFPVATGWTYPTMLAFVPALFVLPTPLAPLAVMVAILLGGLPGFVSGRTPLKRLPGYVADAWYAIGPALVIVLAGAQLFAWSHWPVYVAALFAQFLVDMAVTIARTWFSEGTKPRVELPLLTWIYITDATLAPLGLLIAAAAVTRPGLVLLALAPTAMLWLFARERQQRMDETLALSTAYRGTAMLLGDVVEADNHYTGMHSREVVDLSVAVAAELGLDATQKRNVEFGALLHDVGKIHVPKEIINKPGPLSDGEWKLMHSHTIDGERMLRQVGGLLASVGGIVRATHEHYDGRGYPDGVAGEDIPIEARIVCACDAYSAMTNDRSYRNAMPTREAFLELRRCAGTHFDPRVVDAIERLAVRSAASEHAWLDYLGSPAPTVPPGAQSPSVKQPSPTVQDPEPAVK